MVFECRSLTARNFEICVDITTLYWRDGKFIVIIETGNKDIIANHIMKQNYIFCGVL